MNRHNFNNLIGRLAKKEACCTCDTHSKITSCLYEGCFRLENSDLDPKIWISGFLINGKHSKYIVPFCARTILSTAKLYTLTTLNDNRVCRWLGQGTFCSAISSLKYRPDFLQAPSTGVQPPLCVQFPWLYHHLHRERPPWRQAMSWQRAFLKSAPKKIHPRR